MATPTLHKSFVSAGRRASPVRKGKDDEVELDGSGRQLQYEKTVHFDHDRTAPVRWPKQDAVRAYIEEHAIIPQDLVLDKVAYGPLSGQTYATRLIDAFYMGRLQPKAHHKLTAVCAVCGAGAAGATGTGHLPDSCPAVFATSPKA